jgi:hypothetical protein
MKQLYAFFLTGSFFLLQSFDMQCRRDCDDVPAINREIVQFVKAHLRQTVGRGECWDLAAEALNSAGARWDRGYGFGREVTPSRECIFPGDIIQFDGVTVKYQKDGYVYEEIMSRHTAVIYEVKAEHCYIVAEQNTSAGGRRVTLNPFDVRHVVKGKYTIYRPVND